MVTWKQNYCQQNGDLITKWRPRNKMATIKQNGDLETKWRLENKMVALNQDGVLEIKRCHWNKMVTLKLAMWIWIVTIKQNVNLDRKWRVITSNLPSHSSLISDTDPEASLSSQAGNPRDQEYELICSRRYPVLAQTLSTPRNLKKKQFNQISIKKINKLVNI